MHNEHSKCKAGHVNMHTANTALHYNDSTYIRMYVIISVHHISPKPQILMRGTLPGQVTGSSEF